MSALQDPCGCCLEAPHDQALLSYLGREYLILRHLPRSPPMSRVTG